MVCIQLFPSQNNIQKKNIGIFLAIVSAGYRLGYFLAIQNGHTPKIPEILGIFLRFQIAEVKRHSMGLQSL